jgi:hypothetical protein
MTQVLKDLKALRKLLSDEKRWTKGVLYRDKYGRAITTENPPKKQICSMCVLGAVNYIASRNNLGNYFLTTNEKGKTAMWGALTVAAQESPIQVNDLGTHAQVLAMIDKAIAIRT